MVGYNAANHSGDVECMYNPGTKHTILTRDVKWANWTNNNTQEDMDLFSVYDYVDKVPGFDEIHVIPSNADNGSKIMHKFPDEGESVGVPKNSSAILVPDGPTPSSGEWYQK